MNTDEYYESQNPYQATIIADIDEKPVDVAAFFRSEPKYVKLVVGMVGRTSIATFMRHKWQFTVVGLLHGLLLFWPLLMVFFGGIIPYVPGIYLSLMIFSFAIFVLFVALVTTISISVSLRILRGEERPVLSSLSDPVALLRAWLHVFLYLATIMLSSLIIMVPLFLGIYVMTSLQQDVTVWGTLIVVVLVVGGIICFGVCASRTSFAIHLIIDHKLNVFSAIAASWQYTRGNYKALTTHRGLIPYRWAAIGFLFVTFGLGIFSLFGFQYCKGVVAYSMVTGQCELLEQLPDEW